MRFYLEDKGDISVGIFTVCETVEVSVGSRELTAEEVEFFKKILPDAINPDAKCWTQEEWDRVNAWPEEESEGE